MLRGATGLRVVIRPDTGSLTIVGTVNGQRIRRRAQGSSPKLAREEAAALEIELLRTGWHGQRRGARSFAEAALSYLEAQPRSEHTKDYVRRMLVGLGDVKLAQVDQDAATRLRRTMLPANARPATYLREVVTPLRAILRHAAECGWCDAPHIAAPKATSGRTAYLLPAEVERVIAAAARHLQPLLIFLVGTGARMAEAVYLDWRDVDLLGGRAIFWADQTKSGKRRNAVLPPRVVAALANLPHREGPVFVSDKGRPYADRRGSYGGQIKKGWKGALRRAGLDRELTPHDLRHTWASWQYALNHDLVRLKSEGGWSSVLLVERYAHLLPAGEQPAIIRWFGHGTDTDAERSEASA
jgi:integrase